MIIQNSNLDFDKYGLIKTSEDGETMTYQKSFDYDILIEVWHYKNVVTIFQINPIGRFKEANKYYCPTQRELDFLLFNGSLGAMFDPLYFVENKRSNVF